MPFHRSVEYCTVSASGTNTNAPYARRAGRTNSHPAQSLVRTPLHREARTSTDVEVGPAGLAERLDASSAFISRRDGSLAQGLLVGRLNGLEQPFRCLLAADHLLELRRPAAR